MDRDDGAPNQPDEGLTMTDPTEPRQAEPMAVTLVRMEGKIDNVVEKVSDLRAEVTLHRGQITGIQSELQQVKSDQAAAAKDLKAADRAREDTAAALEKQTADQVAKAKAAVDNSTQRWSPALRFAVIFGTVFTGVGVLVAAFVAMRPAGA